MENNNYLSSGVNYIPLTVLDKSSLVFINENGGNFDSGTKQGTTVGSNGKYCFGLGAPTQFFWENNGVYDQAGIHYTEGDSGVFVNNTGDRGIAVWLYFGDNYNPDEAVSSIGEGSEGYTDPSEGTIGYWQQYTYILPNQNATIPWIMDDEVGAQSTRMYFQYRNGRVTANSLEEWDGTGGSHNLSWSYNNPPTGQIVYGAEDLLPVTFANLSELETISSNEGLDSINLMCMSVTGALLIDSSPSNYTMEKDVLILNTDEDVWVDNMTLGDMFDNKMWGPISSQYFEIEDLTYATVNGNKIAIGDELTRVVSGDAQAGSHFLLNGLEIKPSEITYNTGTDQTTFVVPITFPAGSDGGDFEVEKFEHYFSRIQAEVVTGFVEGSLMEGAKVSARGKGGEILTVYTDANGKYTFPEPVTGDIIATGGTNSITNETVHDPSNEEVVNSSDLTTTRAPFKTNATLGGIVNAQSTLIVDLMKNHNMNKDTAVDAFIDAGKTLYDLDSSVTRQQLNAYLKVGMVGLQNSDSDDTTLYAEMLKTNKAITELEEGFTNGGTSDNATLKEKRKAAVQLRKATTDIISSAAKNKLTQNANSYLATAGSDSNLGTIGTNASDTSKNDLLYLINAKAIEEIDSKLTSTAKNLSSKADWKLAAATVVAAVSEVPFKGIKELSSGISYEEIFMHYNESAMRRKAGSNKVYDKKRLGLTPSKTDFINEANNTMNFRISIVDGNYQTTGNVTDAKGNTTAVSKTGSTRYSDANMADIKSEISRGGKIYEIKRENGKIVESEKTTNQLVVWGTGFARATYITGETHSAALHSFNESELLINSDEFMVNSKNIRYNNQALSEWFSDEKFDSFYPALIGQDSDSVHASLFKPSYKFVIGNHIRVNDENGQLRNWNIVDYKTGRAYAQPGSQEEFDLLEIINRYIEATGLTGYLVDSIRNIVSASSGLKRDTDGDGVPDGTDAFPNDATEWGDRDGDSVGDGTDAFPNDATETIDSDGDGVGDNADVFPNDATETIDSDSDGVGDNADDFPNDPTKSSITPWLGTFRVGVSGTGNGSLTLKTWFNVLTNVDINWGDGSAVQTFSGSRPTHTYAVAGDYQVSFKFKGTEYWQSNNRSLTSSGDSYKLISIEQWGSYVWNTNTLWGEVTANVTATDVPTLTQNFSGFGKSNFTLSAAATTAWENIDLTPVRSMSSLFANCYTGVAQFGIDKWDTSQVTNMASTFSQRSPGDLVRNWNTSNVTSMSSMFASSAVGGDTVKTKVVNLGQANEYVAWDVSKVTSFYGFSSYGNVGAGTLDISNWQINTDAPVSMQNMFFRGGIPMEDLAKKTVTLENGTSYEAWNTSQVTSIRSMFYRASTSALNINNTTWDTRNITDMQDFFYSYSGYGIPQQWDRDISGWDLSALTNKNLGLFNYNNMNTAKFSTENYDAMLIAWNTAGYTGISANFGKSQYTPGGAAEAAKTSLASKGWTITDGGAAPRKFKMSVIIPAGSTNFTIPANNARINWGDGTTETVTSQTTHAYASSETDVTYTIEIDQFTGFNTVWNDWYKKSILQWGDIEWENNTWFASTSSGAMQWRIEAPAGTGNAPDLSNVTSLYSMFGSTNYKTDIGTGWFEDTNDNLEHWDVSTITNMSYMFRNPDPIATKESEAENLLKCGNWDVSNVTNFMYFMGGYSGSVRGSWSVQLNIDMEKWDTSSATNMSYMFWNHGKTKTGIENFITDNVTNFQHFYGGGTWDANTKMVNDILRWNVSNLEDFSNMSLSVGDDVEQFNANFPSNWKLSDNVEKNLNFYQFCGGHYMRIGAGPYRLTDLDAFATKTINEDWYGGSSYTAWDMTNASNINNFGGSTFRGTPPQGQFRNYNISTWNISSKCTSFNNLFVAGRAVNSLSNPFDQDLSGWDVTGITGNQGLFMGGQEYGTIPFTMSTTNYDKTLISWGNQSVKSGVTVDFGNSKYTSHGDAELKRQSLLNAGCTITDGGFVLKEFFYDGGEGESTSATACSLDIPETKGYFYGSGSYPVEGDEIYNSSTGGESNYMAEGYYKILKTEGEYGYVFTSGDGAVEEAGECTSSVQYNYGNADRGHEGACSAEALSNAFYVAEEISESMPETVYSDAALTTAIDFSRSADGYYPFQLNGSSTRQTFNLKRGAFGAIQSCR